MVASYAAAGATPSPTSVDSQLVQLYASCGYTIDHSTGTVTRAVAQTCNLHVNWTATKGSQTLSGGQDISVHAI